MADEGEWAKKGKLKLMDDVTPFCADRARELPPGTPDAERLDKLISCVSKVVETAPAELVKIEAKCKEEAKDQEALGTCILEKIVPSRSTSRPSAPPPQVTRSPADAQGEYCRKEAEKARTPHMNANFMEWCLADVPVKARPAYAPPVVRVWSDSSATCSAVRVWSDSRS